MFFLKIITRVQVRYYLVWWEPAPTRRLLLGPGLCGDLDPVINCKPAHGQFCTLPNMASLADDYMYSRYIYSLVHTSSICAIETTKVRDVHSLHDI